MHATLKVVLCVAGFGFSLALDYGVSTVCSVNSVNACLQPFIEKYGPQDQSTFFSKSNVEHVQKMCEDYTEARKCLDRFISSCDAGTKTVFQGVNNMYDYVCGEGMPLLLRHQQCLESPALVSELTVCNTTASVKLQDVQQKLYNYQMSAYFGDSDAGDIDRLMGQLCDVMKELMHCVRGSVLEHCGQEAVTFVISATQLVVEPSMSQIGCDVHSWGLLNSQPSGIGHTGQREEDSEEEEEGGRLWPPGSKSSSRSSSRSSSSSSSSSSETKDANKDWWMEGSNEAGAIETLPVPTEMYKCTESAVQQCVQPFINRYGLQDQTALFAHSATRDENAMRQVCRDFSSVKRCINSFLPHCDETNKRIFEGLYDMYDYTCGDGLYLYLAHQQCFARPDLEQELKACNTTAADTYKEIQDHMKQAHYHSKPDVDKMKKKLCRTTRKLVSCMKDSVNKHCGSDAAEFATTVVNKMLGPTMKEVECQAKMSFTAWLAIAVAIGLLLVAILAVSLRLYVRSHRQHSRRQRHHEAIVSGQVGNWSDQTVYRNTTTPLATNQDAPPAYSDVDHKDTEPMLKVDSDVLKPDVAREAHWASQPPPPYSHA